MEWSNITFDWNRARAFLVTAEEGSLSAAARALGLAQPTLGRQVDALEAELGVVLFERVGRGLALTPQGAALAAHVRAMGEAASRLSLAAAGQSEDMEGEVTLAASETFAAHVLPPVLADLRRTEPRIRVRLVASSGTADLLAREADIALRNFRPTEPDLIARKLGEARARIYGTPDYLASVEASAPITRPSDLARASFVGVGDTEAMIAALGHMGVPLDRGNFVLTCEDFNVMWAMVCAGMGLGIIDTRVGDGEARVRVALEAMAPIPYPVWLVAHREILTSRRLRFVYDFLAEAMGRAG